MRDVLRSVAIWHLKAHMAEMETELLTPEKTPPSARHGTGLLGCILAASGSTLSTFCLLGAAAAAATWAIANLLGIPEMMLWGLMALAFIPVLWATVWTAGRAWHVERRLEDGLDVDVPVFSMTHYFRKKG